MKVKTKQKGVIRNCLDTKKNIVLAPEGVGEVPDPVVPHNATVPGQDRPQLGDLTLSQVHNLDPSSGHF